MRFIVALLSLWLIVNMFLTGFIISMADEIHNRKCDAEGALFEGYECLRQDGGKCTLWAHPDIWTEA